MDSDFKLNPKVLKNISSLKQIAQSLEGLYENISSNISEDKTYDNLQRTVNSQRINTNQVQESTKQLQAHIGCVNAMVKDVQAGVQKMKEVTKSVDQDLQEVLHAVDAQQTTSLDYVQHVEDLIKSLTSLAAINSTSFPSAVINASAKSASSLASTSIPQGPTSGSEASSTKNKRPKTLDDQDISLASGFSHENRKANSLPSQSKQQESSTATTNCAHAAKLNSSDKSSSLQFPSQAKHALQLQCSGKVKRPVCGICKLAYPQRSSTLHLLERHNGKAIIEINGGIAHFRCHDSAVLML
jgi:hypothetical protein